MTNSDHRALAQTLNSVKGKVALSGYHGPLYDELYHNWWRIEADPKLCHSVKKERTEILWLNYDPAESAEIGQQLRLYEKRESEYQCLPTKSEPSSITLFSG